VLKRARDRFLAPHAALAPKRGRCACGAEFGAEGCALTNHWERRR
jgi:hypothetical protein